jgi:hypothetical protein
MTAADALAAALATKGEGWGLGFGVVGLSWVGC